MPVSRMCVSCGIMHEQNELTKLGRAYVCKSCLETKYVICPDCGKWIEASDLVEKILESGPKKVCPSCAKNYKTCKICGFEQAASEMVKLQSGGFACKTHEGIWAKSFFSESYDLTQSMIRIADENGEPICIMSEELGRLPRGAQGAFPSASPNGLNKVPVFTARRTNCEFCGDDFISLKEIWYHHSNFGGTVRNKIICFDCREHKQIHDCGHATPKGTPSIIIPKIRNSTTEPDADGCLPATREGSRATTSIELGDRVCPECFRTYAERAEGKNVAFILNYSFTPDPLVMHKMDQEPGPFMGFELEVDKGRNSEKVASRILQEVGRKHLYIKKDGSLSEAGFEQVTHPATMEYYLENRSKYEKLLDIPKEAGFRSHDAQTCGLHVHVDRGFFSEEERELGIRKVLFITEKFFPEIFIFSRRDASSASQWAHRWLPALDGALLSADQLETVFEPNMGDGNRRKLVNLQKSPTMEFRIFRGTLNKVTFWATLELVHNIVSLAKTVERTALDTLTWMDIINFQQYPELDEYNGKRVGTGWSGKSRVMAQQILDASEDTAEELDIPDIVDQASLVMIPGYQLRDTQTGWLEACKLLLGKHLLGPDSCFISASRRGKAILATKVPSVEFKLKDGALYRSDRSTPSLIHWIIVPGSAREALTEPEKIIFDAGVARSIDYIVKEAF